MTKYLILGLIGLAFLPAPEVNSAEQQLSIFGNFRGSLNQIDDKLCGYEATCDENSGYDGISFRNNASILGLGGSYTENKLTAYFKYILRAHNDEIFNGGNAQTIIYTAGVRGKAGDLSYGVGSTPYKISGMKLDPFWDTSASARGFDGPGVGLSDLTWGFTKNLIHWNSYQLIEDIKLDLAIIIDDSDSDEHDYNFGATYTGDSFSGGLQFLQTSQTHPTAKSKAAADSLRLWTKYQQAKWDVALSVEEINHKQPQPGMLMVEDQNHFFIAANYQFSETYRLVIAYGDSHATDFIALDGSGGTVGVFHQLFAKVEVYALLNRINRNNLIASDSNVFSIGFNYNFSANLISH